MIRGDAFKLYVVFCVIVGFFGALVSSFIGGNAGREAALQAMYVEPAFAFHGLRIVKPILTTGEAPELGFGYSKRKDCSPPGGDGEILFKVYEGEDVTRVDKGLSLNKLPPGEDFPDVKRTIHGWPNLAPGSYELGMRVVFTCDKERDPQIFTPNKIPFEVLEQ